MDIKLFFLFERFFYFIIMLYIIYICISNKISFTKLFYNNYSDIDNMF